MICPVKDAAGDTWAIWAASGLFIIVHKVAGSNVWLLESDAYDDPDPAIKAMRARIAQS